MPSVLAISSQVVHGHVGNSASAFVLQRLGVHVLPVPTIVLSSHPGIIPHTIQRIAPDTLDEMLGALAANGWLERLDAVQTGYLPSAAHVSVAAKWVRRLRAAGALYVCDPIIGDAPGGLYVPEASARAIGEALLPLADVATPNRFELGWFAGAEIADVAGAVAAARRLPAASVLATSCPADGKLANALITGAGAWRTEVGAHERAIPGAGDFFAALWLARVLGGESWESALALATAGTEGAIAASGGEGIDIIGTQDLWTAPAPWPVVSV
jgi:pyridoxine kinase